MKHLTIDIYNVPQTFLEDSQRLSATLIELPTVIGMQRATEPLVSILEPYDGLPESITGFVIIYTSHISFHSWPSFGLLNFDVFSCQDFEVVDVIEYLTGKFDVKDTRDIEINEIDRAVRSTRDMMLVSSSATAP